MSDPVVFSNCIIAKDALNISPVDSYKVYDAEEVFTDFNKQKKQGEEKLLIKKFRNFDDPCITNNNHQSC